jgi:hypothetical protein
MEDAQSHAPRAPMQASLPEALRTLVALLQFDLVPKEVIFRIESGIADSRARIEIERIGKRDKALKQLRGGAHVKAKPRGEALASELRKHLKKQSYQRAVEQFEGFGILPSGNDEHLFCALYWNNGRVLGSSAISQIIGGTYGKSGADRRRRCRRRANDAL